MPSAGATAYTVANTADLQAREMELDIGATGGIGAAALPIFAGTGAHLTVTSRQPEPNREAVAFSHSKRMPATLLGKLVIRFLL